jgi:hypothetical protein
MLCIRPTSCTLGYVNARNRRINTVTTHLRSRFSWIYIKLNLLNLLVTANYTTLKLDIYIEDPYIHEGIQMWLRILMETQREILKKGFFAWSSSNIPNIHERF